MVVNVKAKQDTGSGSGRALLFKLFISTLYLSTFTFGGGYVIVTLMKKKFVDEYHWIDEQEMLDLVAIAQSSPGAIAVNGAIVVGYKLSGMAGVIPPFVILSVISLFYAAFRSNLVVGWMLNGMQAGVGAVIAQVVWEMGGTIVKARQWISVCIMVAAFAANYVFGVNVILIILICALIGVVRTMRSEKARKKGERAS